jgi:beta-galactosidase
MLETAGTPAKVRLIPENGPMRGDGESLAYVRVELVDGDGRIVPDAAVKLMAEVNGAARLLGFGSGNPVTDENYTRGEFASYRGRALAVLRSGYTAGTAALTVTAGGLGSAEIELPVGG